MNFTLKNQLAERLAARGLRQSQLAFRLDMSRAYVSRLCSGQIQPSVVAALRIAKDFKMPVDQIFQLVEEDTQTISHPCRLRTGTTNNAGNNKQQKTTW